MASSRWRQRKSGKSVSPHQATLLINRQDGVFLDIRERKDFDKGHIVDAINIPLAKLHERITELEKKKDVPIVVVCQMGQQSGEAVKALEAKGIDFVDVGTSGGVHGEERGFCLMVGGDTDAVQRLAPIFTTLAPGVDAAASQAFDALRQAGAEVVVAGDAALAVPENVDRAEFLDHGTEHGRHLRLVGDIRAISHSLHTMLADRLHDFARLRLARGRGELGEAPQILVQAVLQTTQGKPTPAGICVQNVGEVQRRLLLRNHFEGKRKW